MLPLGLGIYFKKYFEEDLFIHFGFFDSPIANFGASGWA